MNGKKPTLDQDEMSWCDVCALADLPAEGGHYVEIGNRALAVIRLAPQGDTEAAPALRVIDDHCPHAGGSLSAGAVADGCVICPWHAWTFDLSTGVCPDASAYRVRVYPVKIENGRVYVQL